MNIKNKFLDAISDFHEIEELINKGLQTDGVHHKQFYLERVAYRLGVNVKEHDEGVCP